MTELLLGAVAVFAFAMVSQRTLPAIVTAPMVFTAIGLLVGGGGFGWFEPGLGVTTTEAVIEATLVLVLFADAVRIDLGALRHHPGPPVRLLGIALPLAILAGAGVALLLFDVPFWEAMLVAAILAPTDAALGAAVVTDPRLPTAVRQTLNVESGLNDGIALPVVTIHIGVVAAESEGETAVEVIGFIARQIGFGLAAGVVAGVAGGWMLVRMHAAGRVTGVFRQLATLAIPIAAFSSAGLAEGNGFIAAFVAGVAFGAVVPRDEHDAVDFTEDSAELLAVATFLIFGAAIIGPRLDDLTWQIAVYVVASLTVVRMVPTLIAMFGSRTLYETRLFFGWFGPRGLASILFMLAVAHELSPATAEPLIPIIAWTVLVSVFAHGLSAAPWAGHLSRRLGELGDEAELVDMPEMADMPDLRTRTCPSSRRR